MGQAEKDFCSTMLGEFSVKNSPEFDLAVLYHVKCETYDRTVCTGPIKRDGIMPASVGELVRINRHAHSVRRELRYQAERSGWNPSEFSRLISNNAVIEEAARQIATMSAAPSDSVEEGKL